MTDNHAEKKMIQLGAVTLALLALAETAMYYGFFAGISGFAKYTPYLFYLVISVVFIGSATWHVKHYRHGFSCNTGMMVGMTIGMMSGFMIGAIIGATNGMFMGSVTGMLTGMAVGALCTRTCGIMPVLEGLMAGLMAGLMGAMTSVMMINENIALFMPLLIGSCIVITGGMSYMVYREGIEAVKPDIFDMINYVSVMFVFTAVITFIIAWGPRSILAI